jgi:hypothetical protein
MADHAERRELSRKAKLANVQEQVKDGSLTIRTATPAERAAWATAGPGGPPGSAPAADPPHVPPTPDSYARAQLATAEDGDA